MNAPELNHAEQAVLATVRHECRYGDPLARRDLVTRLAGRVGPKVIDQALASLVDSGLIRRPSRGYYLPTKEAPGDA